MRLLLDTHTALWWWMNSPSLSQAASLAMADPLHDVYFSAASAYEIHQKHRLGKLVLPTDLIGQKLAQTVREEGWQQLPLQVIEASLAAALDHPHSDPFDRMLAAQSQLGSFTLVTTDSFFANIGIDCLW